MRKAPPLTEEHKASFNEHIKDEKVNSTRIVVTLGALLFIIYSFMDYFALPSDTLFIIYSTRGVNLLVMALILAVTFKPIFTEQYNKIVMFGYISSGITLSIGIYFSQPAEYTYDLYFAALMILVMTAFSWSYLPIKYPVLMSVTLIALYVIIKVFIHQDTQGSRIFTLVSHISLLASACIVAAIAQYIRDKLIYKNIKLQEELKATADKKTKEAKKNKKLANIDMLTGIPNRRYITDCLRKELSKAKQTNTLLTLVFLDLNGFKKINDTYGHDSGDKVLEITAKRMLQTVRKEDYVARLGGDEFLIGIKSNHFSAKFIDNFCDKLKANILAPIAFNGQILKVGASIGVSSYPADGKSFEELIKIADKHMYIDKQASKSEESSLSRNISA